jgi:hypothetical protein
MRTGSHIQARFKGSTAQRTRDYAWFAMGATFPAFPDAERAARIIVRGIRRGDPEIAFSLPFAVAGRLAGLAPNFTAHVSRIAARLLPTSGDSTPDDAIVSGAEVAETLDSGLLDRLTAAGRPAIAAYNQRRAEHATNERSG